MNIAEIIKINRQKNNLTREQLAKLSGVSKDSIYAWEKGKRIPSIYSADKVLKALNIEMAIGKKRK